jgi:hypothetical protein
MRRVAGLSASLVFGIVIMANAQTKRTTQESPAADPDVVTVSACVTKGADGVFMLTKAHRVSGSTQAAASSATWAVDIAPLAAEVLNMDGRVGQRVEAVGRIATTTSTSSTTASPGSTGTGANPRLQVRSVKPIEISATKGSKEASGCS